MAKERLKRIKGNIWDNTVLMPREETHQQPRAEAVLYSKKTQTNKELYTYRLLLPFCVSNMCNVIRRGHVSTHIFINFPFHV